jgi:hypothetical protein
MIGRYFWTDIVANGLGRQVDALKASRDAELSASYSYSYKEEITLI